MIFKYVRCSTSEQSTKLQLDAMEHIKHDELFEDYQTGRNTDRPRLNDLISKVRKGDIIYFYDVSRIARNLKALLILVDELQELGVNIVIVKEGIDLSTDMGRLMLSLLGGVAEMESSNISRKVKAGMKASNKKVGRPNLKLDGKQKKHLKNYQEGRVNATDTIKLMNIGRTAFYRLLK